ncbi:hypothetical protein PCANC_09624 [Puccinia coronata f. sp. avenae]|uniref:Uncharacterized protein n=1 Tax=Puccinia coronata f. sp. avenae TaxID=200324 RepID=A0A2N5V1P3_9BASI|nr:hypothetical protein PCANC_09624 [Puccinia coronata f. sp. avenae]
MASKNTTLVLPGHLPPSISTFLYTHIIHSVASARMLSTRPATPFPSSPVLDAKKEELALDENNNTHNTIPSKIRLPSRLPSINTPRGGSFRSISERISQHERPTFEASRGPVPAVFRNKRIDMNRLKNIDMDAAFGPSKRRSLSGTLTNVPLVADRGSSLMSGSRLQSQAGLTHKRLSCSVNGR